MEALTHNPVFSKYEMKAITLNIYLAQFETSERQKTCLSIQT
jgi:hypothetical protein